MKDEALRKG
jgi:hypothetical protein